MLYHNRLEQLAETPPLLSDYPEYVEPLQTDDRYLAPPLLDEADADLQVRAWRWWYNARGIIETVNHLQASATAIIMVHPWGVDDGAGLQTPEPAGIAFNCTRPKNLLISQHIDDVVGPFLTRLRSRVALVGYSLPGVEDEIRRMLYASVDTEPESLDEAAGRRLLAELLAGHQFAGQALVERLYLDAKHPVSSYLAQTPGTDASELYNGSGFWKLPMPLHAALHHDPADRVFYDAEGYPKVRDYLKRRGIRHVLLCGYATDMCVMATTCGYNNLSADFNVFLVGDATMATFPGSRTPKYATQVALANAALRQLVTQVNWVQAR